MLWVNLIMDTLGALALATEPPTDDILLREPYKKDNAIVTEVMWRNVFGHAIYQIFALVFMIFAAPGWLCADYWTKCYTYDDTGIKCIEWNPFFTDNVYQNEDSISWWTSKSLTKDDFNKEALNKMICQNYQEKNGKNAVCTDAVLADAANLYLPSDFQPWDETEKLLHYTLVFQVFVFLQLFNQINARKLEADEFNVFSGMLSNFLFVGVVIFTFTIQMVMVEIGGMAVKTHALSVELNLVCILIGSFELVWGIIIKFMPLKFF
jgi:magnesium-transporting ATPase (P-type)